MNWHLRASIAMTISYCLIVTLFVVVNGYDCGPAWLHNLAKDGRCVETFGIAVVCAWAWWIIDWLLDGCEQFACF
jgi:hypothetical protein